MLAKNRRTERRFAKEYESCLILTCGEPGLLIGETRVDFPGLAKLLHRLGKRGIKTRVRGPRATPVLRGELVDQAHADPGLIEATLQELSPSEAA